MRGRFAGQGNGGNSKSANTSSDPLRCAARATFPYWGRLRGCEFVSFPFVGAAALGGPTRAAGNYTGTGAAITVDLGFRPSFLAVSGSKTSYPTGVDKFGAYDVFTGGTILTETVTFTDTGFTLHYRESNEYPQLIQSGRLYNYIAFR